MCNCHCSDSSYCSNAIGLLALQYSSQVGVVLAILGINMLLSLTSRRLTLFEKHHTRSSEARALAHRLFLAQVRNKARQRHPKVSLASHDRTGTHTMCVPAAAAADAAAAAADTHTTRTLVA